MKTAVVGGGRGCRSLLELISEGGLTELTPDVALVCDADPNAEGLKFARKQGIPTCTDLSTVLELPGLELVVELTGRSEVADELHHRLPAGVRMLDHTVARVFWDTIRAERRLRREREQVQKILDSMPDIVMVLDRDMKIETVNAGFTAYTGIAREDARGRACHVALCGREDVPEWDGQACPFREVVRTGKRATLTQVRPGAKGGEEHFELTMTPVTDWRGRVTQVVESLHPITERVRLKREVEQFARRFRRFIDSAHDLISIKDLEGRYEELNQATADFFGMNVADCIGRTAAELYPPEIARMIVEHDRDVVRRKQAISYEETFVIHGREVHTSTVRFPMLDYKGDAVGVCTISRDVTGEKRMQRELVNADKLAAIGKLAAGIAHEINNPLTGVLAFAEDLIEDSEEGDPRVDDYRVIVRETLRCREIVRNLLDFARQTKPHVREVQINEVVERSLRLVERLPSFRDLAIRRELAPELPPIFGDPQQLQQVVLNLLVNASEALEGRGGKIGIATGLAAGEAAVRIEVTDDGPGLPDDAKDRIFEPFFSTKSTTHGLGLAVSWGIVERHGGRIDVGNRPEGGARFTVVLPTCGV